MPSTDVCPAWAKSSDCRAIRTRRTPPTATTQGSRRRRVQSLFAEEAGRPAASGCRHCRSRLNFYIVNSAVIAPPCELPSEARVAERPRSAFPDREIVVLPAAARTTAAESTS